jgi:hypothetical protein
MSFATHDISMITAPAAQLLRDRMVVTRAHGRRISSG